MNFKWISIVYFAFLLQWNVYGQNAACNKDARTLGSCDGSEVSDNNIDIDFGEIEDQCSCSISPNFSGQAFYTLARNPGYADCGTAVIVIDSNNEKYRLPCATSPGTVVLTNRSGFVELKQENDIDGPKDYCLRVFSNDVSNIITASCGISESTKTVIPRSTPIGLEVVSTQTTPVVVRMNNERIYFPKWEILGAAVGVSLLLFLIIILLVKRNRKRSIKNKIHYMKESLVIQNQVLEERDKNVRELTENPLYQPADDFEKSQSSNPVNSEGKQTQSQGKDIPLDEFECGLRENPLYQSADNESNETEENTRTESNANYSYYSEIDGNPEKMRDICATYDYAYTCSLAKSTDNEDVPK